MRWCSSSEWISPVGRVLRGATGWWPKDGDTGYLRAQQIFCAVVSDVVSRVDT